MGSAAVMLFGTMLPWATLNTFLGGMSVTGLSGDGVLVFFLAVVAAAALAAHVFVQGTWTRHLPWVALGAGALPALICLVSVFNVSGAGNEYASAGVGMGLILCLLASIALAITAFLYRRES